MCSISQNLLLWVHPGFSVFAGPPVATPALTSLESQARYTTRPALAMDALQKLDDGRLALETNHGLSSRQESEPRQAVGDILEPQPLEGSPRWCAGLLVPAQ